MTRDEIEIGKLYRLKIFIDGGRLLGVGSLHGVVQVLSRPRKHKMARPEWDFYSVRVKVLKEFEGSTKFVGKIIPGITIIWLRPLRKKTIPAQEVRP